MFLIFIMKYGFLPFILPALAGLAGSLISTGIQSNAQSAANKEQIDYARESYAQQRKDALSDWALQNAYNSPRAQMQRFQEAGLNPNLIYGQMTNSPAVRSVDMKSYDPKPAAGADLGQGILAAVDLASRTAQLDNLSAQNAVLKQEAALRKEQTTGIQLDNKLKDQGLGFTLEGKKLRNKQMEADTRGRIIANSTSYREAIERILTQQINRSKSQQEINNLRQMLAAMKQDFGIKSLDAERARNGQRPGETAVNASLSRLWKKVSGIDSGLDSVWTEARRNSRSRIK